MLRLESETSFLRHEYDRDVILCGPFQCANYEVLRRLRMRIDRVRLVFACPNRLHFHRLRLAEIVGPIGRLIRLRILHLIRTHVKSSREIAICPTRIYERGKAVKGKFPQ